jgi:peptidoglycan/xylan/chitin deacetylase (PgdA/CDA1 family)
MFANRTPRITVVTLHRVGPQFKIKPVDVTRCFKFLSTHFNVVLPSELGHVGHERRVAVVTIDDGHADAYYHIFPIARDFKVPVSLCIPADFFFRSQWLWFDKLTFAQQATPTATGKGLRTCGEAFGSFDELRAYLKGCPPTMRDAAIDELLRSLDLRLPPSPLEEYRALTESELREMLSSGLVEVVGHTVSHTIATILNESDLETELRQAKSEWELFLAKPFTSFCYPNGLQGDFDERTALALRRAGYHYAFTSLQGTNLVRTMNPLEMKRVHIHSKPGVCAKLLSGLADLQNSLGTPGPEKAGGK